MVDDNKKHHGDKHKDHANEQDKHQCAGSKEAVIDLLFCNGLFKMRCNETREINID